MERTAPPVPSVAFAASCSKLGKGGTELPFPPSKPQAVAEGGESDGAQSDDILSHVVLPAVGLGGAGHGRKAGWVRVRRPIPSSRVLLGRGSPLLLMVTPNNCKRKNPQISQAGGNLWTVPAVFIAFTQDVTLPWRNQYFAESDVSNG